MKIALDKVCDVYYTVSIDNKEVINVTSKTANVQSAPLKNCRELAAMLKKLPKEERLRVEGIIIGVGMRCQQVDTQSSA